MMIYLIFCKKLNQTTKNLWIIFRKPHIISKLRQHCNGDVFLDSYLDSLDWFGNEM